MCKNKAYVKQERKAERTRNALVQYIVTLSPCTDKYMSE